MKVLVLGGAGDMGRMGVTTLLNAPNIASVTIADKNYELAKAFLNLVDSDRLSAVETDITDHSRLVDLISNHDLVLNTVGPYFRFGKMVIEACIEAQKPGVDICDDWEPMLEALELSEKAKKAGVPLIVGMGASPGMSNLMTVLACQDLDEVDEIVTAFGLSGNVQFAEKQPHHVSRKRLMALAAGQPNAAMEHLLHECIGKIPTFSDGKIIEIDSLTEAAPVSFPGFKDAYACHIGHPEPVTLPRTIKAKAISNVMFTSRIVTDVLREYVRKIMNNEITVQEAASAFEKEFREILKMPTVMAETSGFPPILNVTVSGLRNNKRKKIAIGLLKAPHGLMAGVTSIPLAVAGLMILEGKVQKRGVLTPEESIDPEEFFNRYAAYCGKDLSARDVLLKKEIDL
ncbi:MAG: saccharopine dehydrogenase NADP-binding domain-containing protein [Deltaproteobacteria bacterium]|nr:saccharopine dehydrogenase NADP-binding domain-containing protein [Deltaproteobacteria bacterium]